MTFRQFLSVVEIRTKVISISTYTIATLYTLSSGHPVSWLDAALLAVAVLCVDMGTTAFNTFYDYARGVDTPHSTVEPGKVLVHEGVGAAHAFLISLVLYTLAAASGIAVAAVSSWWILPAGIVSMLVGFLYTGGPFPISRTPLGELFAGGFLGSVLFLVVYAVHVGSIDAGAAIASIPGTLLIGAVLTVNNTCDIEGDRAAGRRTLSIVLGRRAAIVLIDLLCAATYGVLVLMATGSFGALLPAGAVAPSLPVTGLPVLAVGLSLTVGILVRMHRRGFDQETKHANMSAIIRVVGIYTVAYAATLALGIASA